MDGPSTQFRTPRRSRRCCDEEADGTCSCSDDDNNGEVVGRSGATSTPGPTIAAATPIAAAREEPETCAVCLSPLRKKSGEESRRGPVFVTPCSHHFHLSCLRGCREYHTSGCPLCRSQLPPGLTPIGAKERHAARRRNEQAAERFPAHLLAAHPGYDPHVIATRAARIRAAVAQRMAVQVG